MKRLDIDRNVRYIDFSLDQLTKIGYQPILPSIIPGSNHFPVIENAVNDFTWAIEYDVSFHGQWSNFFEAHQDSDADFLSAYIEVYGNQRWLWWKSMVFPENKPIILYKSFNPVYRISKRAAQYLKSLYLRGWKGHHEVSMATLLIQGGFKVEDLGWTGEFTRPINYGKWYSTDTYWHDGPIVSMDEEHSNVLYHPRKH